MAKHWNSLDLSDSSMLKAIMSGLKSTFEIREESAFFLHMELFGQSINRFSRFEVSGDLDFQ
jgi:hypothetical protein